MQPRGWAPQLAQPGLDPGGGVIGWVGHALNVNSQAQKTEYANLGQNGNGIELSNILLRLNRIDDEVTGKVETQVDAR